MLPIFEIPEFSQTTINQSYNQEKNLGSSFEKLIFQLLQAEGENAKKFPPGKDGGIDIFCADKGMVIECKDTFDPLSAWAVVEERFSRNITSPEGPPSRQSQYQPWYEQDENLKINSYHYYFSGTEPNAAKNIELRKAISDFFKRLVQQYPHLQHLTDLEIKVFSWQDIKSRLERFPQLCMRWFPNMRLPGLKLFKEPSQPANFRKFLYEGALPYCLLPQHELKPLHILSQLESNQAAGAVVSGQGGSGKTRLCLEVARAAKDKNWLVLELKEKQHQEAIKALELYIPSEQKVLLVLDYIETSTDSFETVANYCLEAREEGARIHYLANCRTAFYENIKGKYDHISLELPLFSGEDQVVRHILSQGNINNWQSFVNSCQGIPVLAVFVLFLHQKQRLTSADANQGLLSSLRQEDTFASWIIQRLEKTFDDTKGYSGQEQRRHRQQLAQLLLHYPLGLDTAEALFGLQSDFEMMHEQLVIDGWIIESDDGYYQVVHDIFADQIVLNALSSPKALPNLAIDSLKQAAQIDNLAPILVSWQRLADNKIVKDLPWIEIIQKQTKQLQPDSAEFFAWYKVRSLLMLFTPVPLEPLLTFIEDTPDLWLGAAQNDSFCYSLDTRLNKEWPNLKPELQSKTLDWLTQLIKDTHYTNTALLNLCIKLNSERFLPVFSLYLKQASTPEKEIKLFTKWLSYSKNTVAITDLFLPWLQEHKQLVKSQFVYKAWLDAGGEISKVESGIEAWLPIHQQTVDAGFVYKAWLNAGGAITKFESSIDSWLSIHQQTLDAGFVYKAWLNAGGARTKVESSIDSWLSIHQHTADAGFVYKAWLDAGGDIRKVESCIEVWLSTYQHALEAGFVYKSWLNAGGEISKIEPSIEEWLLIHQQTLDAGFVYKAWLNAGGERKEIESSIEAWLSIHQQTVDAQFLYCAWLNTGGEPSKVESGIEAWLSVHQQTAEAQFLYCAWLNAGGEISKVESGIESWLSAHQQTVDAQFLYCAWLNTGGEPSKVESGIEAWLSVHQQTAEAQFLYCAWLNAGGERSKVESGIEAWLSIHQKTVEARFVYKAWLDTGGERSKVESGIEAWLSIHQKTVEARFVYKAWLDTGGERSKVESGIEEWLSEHQQTVEAGFVYSPWLSAGGEPSKIESSIEAWLSTHKQIPEAQFVYCAWLNAGGEISKVESGIESWLSAHQHTAEARFLYCAWLNAGGEISKVESSIEAWLSIHQQAEEASFVYCAWLNAGGEPSKVESIIDSWLSIHQKTAEAGFVYKVWLDAGGERSKVESGIEAWLSIHQKTTEARFVYKAWLDAGGEISKVESSIEAWLSIHQKTAEARFVYKAWLDAGGEISKVESSIEAWLSIHQKTAEARFVYKAWLDAGGSLKDIQVLIKLWCEDYQSLSESSFVVSAWIKAGGSLMEVAPVIDFHFKELQSNFDPKGKELVAKFVDVYYLLRELPDKESNTYWRQLMAGFSAWFTAFADFNHLMLLHTNWKQQSPGFIHLIEEALQAEVLKPDQNEAQLSACFKWVNSWPLKRKKKIEEDILKLQQEWELGFEVTFVK